MKQPPGCAIGDLMSYAGSLNPACAYLAAQRAHYRNNLRRSRTLNDMESAVGKTEATVEADLRFHLAILEATHNTFMRPFGAWWQDWTASQLQTHEFRYRGVSSVADQASGGFRIHSKQESSGCRARDGVCVAWFSKRPWSIARTQTVPSKGKKKVTSSRAIQRST